MKLKIIEFLLSLIVDPSKDLSAISDDLYTLTNGARHSTWRTDAIHGIIDLHKACSHFEKKHLLTPLIKRYESVNYGQYDDVIFNLKDLDTHINLICDINKHDVAVKIVLPGVDFKKFEPLNASKISVAVEELERDPDTDKKAADLIKVHSTKVASIVQTLLTKC